jgi:hypothetical protein
MDEYSSQIIVMKVDILQYIKYIHT